VKLELKHMHDVWQRCWLAMPASMVGNRFVVLAILQDLHTSFHWATLAKAYKQLWKDFVVRILFAVHVADAFGSRSPRTTMKVMSTSLSKHLKEHLRDEFKRSKLHANYGGCPRLRFHQVSPPLRTQIVTAKNARLQGRPITCTCA
jgi:hypothetical protein